MCSGCKELFAKSYKARHQVVCPASSVGVMLPVVSVENCKLVEKHTHTFKELLNSLLLDEVGNYRLRHTKNKDVRQLHASSRNSEAIDV